MPDREAIANVAKYLRNVRPIDPEEASEYVEGTPHPGVVRQVLREEAFDLGLIERDDGTFVPVDDDPVVPGGLPVERFPERYARRLEDLLVEEYGPGWPDGESGDRLRRTIRRLKDAYYRGRDVEYDRDAALGYAIYHLPDYYAAIQYVLAELAEDRLLSRKLRVLDVGAGVGGPAAGLADFLPSDALVAYDAVEPSPAADVLEALLAETGRNFHATVHRTRIEEFEPDAEYDLVLFANVLSELADPVAAADRLFGALAEDGAAVLLSPADRETTRTLRSVERTLAGGTPPGATEASDGPTPRATVYSPTVRLWPDEAPGDEGWSFVRRPDLAVPGFQRRLDEAATDPDHESGEFVNVDVQYAYATLRRDGRCRIDFEPSRSDWAKLAESERHVGDRIDCLWVKLSGNLAEEGNALFKVGDGSEREDHFAVVAKETGANRDLLAAEYGDLLLAESVLVLWNDDEGAYNLVVDGETGVERVPAPV